MANLLKTIIENDRGEIKRLEKMADKVFSYEDQMAALTDDELKRKQLSLSNATKMVSLWMISCTRLLQLFVKLQNGFLVCSHTKVQVMGESSFTMVTYQRCVQGRKNPDSNHAGILECLVWQRGARLSPSMNT